MRRTRTIRRPRVLRSAAAIAAGALLMSACGGSSTAGGTSSSAPATAASTSATSPAASGSATGGSAAGGSGASGSGASAPAQSGTASTDTAALDQVCAAGKQEGQVNVRTGGDASVVNAELAPFTAKYGITVNYTSMKPQDDAQAVVAEEQTHNTLSVDLIGGDDIPSAAPLLKAGYVDNTDWTSLGIPKDLQISVSGVTLFRFSLVLGGLSYDSTKTKPEDLPDTWDALVDAKYQGKVIVDPRGKFLSTLALAWGKDKTVQWYTNLMNTVKPVSVNGESASLTKVISGEVPISTSGHNAQVAETNAESGTKLAMKYLDVIPAEAQFPIVLKDAPHKNAAQCLAAWYVSTEGRASVYAKEFTSPDVPADLPAGATVVYDNSSDAGDLDADTAQELAKLTTG
jgi:iron(III) transport system substrate-binding protein